jgi:outer membrane biosynthesis protein TonB
MMKGMRIVLFIALLSIFSGLKAQEEIVAKPGEYVEAQNYGGKKEFKRFLLHEMNYPAIALANKKEGTVEVASIVNSKTGIRSNLHVKKSVSKELDAEAIRLYKLILFTPTFFKGDDVITYSTLKFKFSVKNYKRACKKRGYENTLDQYSSVIDTFKVYKDNQVSVKPRALFKDTLENISTFIQKNMNYPQGTLSLNITGTVKLFFVVEPSGRITNIKLQKTVGGGASEEAIRLLYLTKWKPGEKDGEKVRVSKTFEVDFNLSSESGMQVAPSSY